MADARTPVIVVTGPGGAAWIRGAVERGDWQRAAVLKGHAGGAPIAGCACCSVQGSLHQALRGLLPKTRLGDIDRVVIETDGPAEPCVTLLGDPVLAAVYRVEDIVTVPEGRQSRLVAEAVDGSKRR